MGDLKGNFAFDYESIYICGKRANLQYGKKDR